MSDSEPNSVAEKITEAATEKIKTASSKDAPHLGPEDWEKFAAEIARLTVDQFREEVKHQQTTHDLRTEYIPRLYGLILGWLVVVVCFVFMTGFSGFNFNNPNCTENCFQFKLADSVLIAFITSTTVAVLGLFLCAAQWLYPSENTKSGIEKKES